MTEWILCKDKMPQDNSWVLVCAGGAMNCMSWCKKRGWDDPCYSECHNIIISQITHWMPLPKAPKYHPLTALIKEWLEEEDEDLEEWPEIVDLFIRIEKEGTEDE